MSRRVLASIAALLALAALGSCQRARMKTAEEIFKEQSQHLASVKDFQFSATQRIEMAQHPLETEASVRFKSPNRFKIHMKLVGMNATVEQDLIGDGTTMWVISPGTLGGGVIKFDINRIDAAMMLGRQGVPLAEMLDPSKAEELSQRMRKSFRITVLPEQKVNGVPAYVLELVPKSGSEGGDMPEEMLAAISRMRIWIGKKDGIQYRSEMYNRDGKLEMAQEVNDARLNAGISDDEFRYTPPPGTKVVDGMEMVHGRGGMGGGGM
jgi:outer membrane lipoprotein-sorting protein